MCSIRNIIEYAKGDVFKLQCSKRFSASTENENHRINKRAIVLLCADAGIKCKVLENDNEINLF